MHLQIIRAFRTMAGVAAFVISSFALAVAQQAPATPIFTAEQAAAGRADYAKQCASCHMPDLSGNIEIPPLAGKPFMDTWSARSTKELFDYLSASMPYGGPSLSVESYLSITAFILRANGAEPGAAPLSASTTVPIGTVTMSTKSLVNEPLDEPTR
jgi:mono/diheme cytochrome c family protein